MDLPRIIITLEGGLVQKITSDIPIDYMVIDLDSNDTDCEEDMFEMFPGKEPVWAHDFGSDGSDRVIVDPEEITRIQKIYYAPHKCRKHEPDVNTVFVQTDGGETYIDVNCIHCGESGCIGTVKNLAENVSWETDGCEGKNET